MDDRIALNDPTYGSIIAAMAGTEYLPMQSVNFARVIDDVFIGGVMYSNFTGESIQAHIASTRPRWVNRDLLFVAFDYPFRQLGVKSIFGFVPEDNINALTFDLNLGFTPVTRIEGMYPDDVACIVVRMTWETCRFLDIKPRTIASGRTLH
jgi:hypothetical protein